MDAKGSNVVTRRDTGPDRCSDYAGPEFSLCARQIRKSLLRKGGGGDRAGGFKRPAKTGSRDGDLPSAIHRRLTAVQAVKQIIDAQTGEKLQR